MPQPLDRPEFARRVLIVFVAAIAFALLVAFGAEIGSLALLAFGAMLFGLGVEGVARFVSRYAPLPHGASVALVLTLLATATGLFIWIFGGRAVGELSQVVEELPTARAKLAAFLEANAPAGMTSLDNWLPKTSTALREGSRWLGRSMGALTTGGVLLVAGAYLAFEPKIYVRAAEHLVPPRHRDEAMGIGKRLVSVLRSWLLARLLSMTAVGILCGGGLWIAGVPLWFGLGVLAGVLAFIPFLGPILSFLPAAAIALAHGGFALLGWVAVIYGGVQLLEGTVITPLIEKWAVSLPPAFLMLVQVFAGLLAGLPGVLFATPLAVVVVFLVQVLYVERTLGDEVTALDDEQ